MFEAQHVNHEIATGKRWSPITRMGAEKAESHTQKQNLNPQNLNDDFGRTLAAYMFQTVGGVEFITYKSYYIFKIPGNLLRAFLMQKTVQSHSHYSARGGGLLRRDSALSARKMSRGMALSHRSWKKLFSC